jgi:Rrf2 family iron-sulfur cluster assembly transcriptional regulator
VADIIRAVDEPLDATQCGGRENCLDDRRCMTHDLWSSLNTRMYDYLASVTLASLVARQREKEAKSGLPAILEDRRSIPRSRSRNVRDKVAAVI